MDDNFDFRFGIVFIAYGAHYEKYLDQIKRAVKIVRHINPHVPIALFSPSSKIDFEVQFHQTINNSMVDREFYTRIITLERSPFLLSLALDSQVIACSPIKTEEILDAMKSNILMIRPKYCDNRRWNGHVIPAGFALLYKKGEEFNRLLTFWKQTHLHHRGHISNFDDQMSLVEAILLASKENINVGYMSSHWFAAAQKSGYGGNPKMRRTGVLHEIPWLFHLDGNDSLVCPQLGPHKDPSGWQVVEIEQKRYMMQGVSMSTIPCTYNCNCVSRKVLSENL